MKLAIFYAETWYFVSKARRLSGFPAAKEEQPLECRNLVGRGHLFNNVIVLCSRLILNITLLA